MRRWTPAAVAFAVVAAALLSTGTPLLDVLRYTAYAALAVVLPGTLVYRALRRTPHTLVEDLAMGAAVGLVLELAAWFAFVSAGAERWLWVWPAAVIAAFLAVPALRRHWVVRGYTPVPAGWAWAVTAVLAGFTAYLWDSFLRRNPILPTTEGQAQYIDLSFQMSIAGAAKHQAPLDVPQVAGSRCTTTGSASRTWAPRHWSAASTCRPSSCASRCRRCARWPSCSSRWWGGGSAAGRTWVWAPRC
ncbi:hypothetical protein Phou_097140 [Phytohabitans houttuyneae]|uniref:Uncharacterized protein n=1 Tax=Phytohabitans houttuyneae TaxID=1076126 RepID=A0A6V8KNU7_9ACTN|nr:hypothetical protein Phou_097140 [Phytohabitans houttuyneae]